MLTGYDVCSEVEEHVDRYDVYSEVEEHVDRVHKAMLHTKVNELTDKTHSKEAVLDGQRRPRRVHRNEPAGAVRNDVRTHRERIGWCLKSSTGG